VNAAAGSSVIRVIVNDSCNRSGFDAQVVDVLPALGPPLYKTASWTNSPGPVQAGDQINYQLKIANYTNQLLLSGAPDHGLSAAQHDLQGGEVPARR